MKTKSFSFGFFSRSRLDKISRSIVTMFGTNHLVNSDPVLMRLRRRGNEEGEMRNVVYEVKCKISGSLGDEVSGLLMS